jgi:hypothetical protein
MTWRTHQAERSFGFAFQHTVNGIARRASRQLRHIERCRTDDRI